jgi:hypothetical protein
MLQQDIDALTNRFFDTPLTYTNGMGATVTLADELILVDNQPDIDPDEATSMWVRFTVDPGSGKRYSLGEQPFYKQLGSAYLQVFIPKGHGTGAGGQIRDAFLDAFRDWTSSDGALTVDQTINRKSSTDAYTMMTAQVLWNSIRPST